MNTQACLGAPQMWDEPCTPTTALPVIAARPTLSSFGVTDTTLRQAKQTLQDFATSEHARLRGITLLCCWGVPLLYLAFWFYPRQVPRDVGHLVATVCMAFTVVPLFGWVCGVMLTVVLRVWWWLAPCAAVNVARRVMKKYARYVAAVRAYEQEQRKTRGGFWVSLGGVEFENELAALFKAQGFAVSLTPTTDDKGVDIRLSKDGRRAIVQCKQHCKSVGPAVAREVYGAMVAERAAIAVLASPRGFTPGVYSFAKGKPIFLLDLDGILRMQEGIVWPDERLRSVPGE